MVCRIYSNLYSRNKFNAMHITNNLIRVRTSDVLLVLVPITQLFQNAFKICINCKWCIDLILDVFELDNRIIWKFSALSSKCKTVFFMISQLLFHLFIRCSMLLISRGIMSGESMQTKAIKICFMIRI